MEQITVKQYTDLITSEHAAKPKFNAYNEAFLDMLLDTAGALYDCMDMYDIETATGDQLDKIGEVVGVSRKLPQTDYNLPAVLDNETYRLLIKSKILQNRWDGTMGGWVIIMEQLFPSNAYDIVDNFDMSVDVLIIDPDFDETLVSLLSLGYILPKPSGVRINYAVVDKPIFGWDTDNEYIKGWDEGQWK